MVAGFTRTRGVELQSGDLAHALMGRWPSCPLYVSHQLMPNLILIGYS